MGHTDLVRQEPAAPGPERLGRPTRVRYQVLAAACLLALISYVYRVGFSALGPDLKRDLALGDQGLGYLLAAFLVAYGAFEVPWGVLGDRFGGRHILTIVAVTSALLTGAVALAGGLPAGWLGSLGFLVVLRFLFGLFQAGLFPPLSRTMADWMPVPERGTAQGIIWMTSRLGGFLAYLLVAALVSCLGGWPAAMGALTALGLLWAAAFWPWLRDRPEDRRGVNAAERALIHGGRLPVPPAQTRRIPWLALLRSRSVWALCLMYGCAGFSGNFFVTWLPTYLRDHRHLLADQAKWLSSLPLACGIAGCGLGGLVSDAIIRRTGNRKWGRRLTGTVGLAGAGVAFLSTIWVQHPVALGILLCLTFFCNDLAMGPAWAACADIGERYAGTLGGKMNMVGNLAGAAEMLLVGYLFQSGNAVLVFVILACGWWLGVLCWLGVDVTRPVAAKT
jgi:ACS family glucarate transporter-like MFS transporter